MAATESPAAEPLTVIVRRRIKPGCEAGFEEAMHEFVRFALPFPGHVDIQVIRTGEREYAVVDRFADRAAREAFVASPVYRERLGGLRAMSDEEPSFQEFSGLGGWFTLPGQTVAPPKTKMAVATLLGVYPLTSVLPPQVANLLSGWHPLAVNLVVSCLVVASLTWLVMPFLTRLLAPWLFRKNP